MAMTIKFIENKLCKTCGNKLHFKNFRKIKANKTGQKKGYTKNNIVIVSNRANRIKSDATVDEIRKVADFYEKLLKN